jgi:hypothetical protein
LPEDVAEILPLEMMGLLFPVAGNFASQPTFFSLPHSKGSLFSVDFPSRSGPRKKGQIGGIGG